MSEFKMNKRKLVNVKPAPGEHIKHDKENCTNCGNCVMICSMNLWQIRSGKVQLAEDYKQYCLECACCFQACEKDAVKFTFPEPGCGVIYAHG
jgi:ferredoxin-like protein FixX